MSLEGLEDFILCRDDQDYDVMVKYIFLCARRKNVIPIIYIVMSNHAHAAVLSGGQRSADAFANELKRCYSLYFSLRYGERKVLGRTGAVVNLLDTDPYVRNALAYIPRNALDAGVRVEDYRWSGYRAMFRDMRGYGLPCNTSGGRKVRNLSKRQCIDLMHTRDRLKDVPWVLDADGCLEPSSACDAAYLESAFLGDQAFFLKTIGSVNPAEMQYRLVDAFSGRLSDGEFYKEVNAVCLRWFQKDMAHLSVAEKIRLLPYVYRTRRTTVAQLARCFSMPRDSVSRYLGK